MSRGLKLDNPFNDAGNLEIEYKPGAIVRVTSNWFRSFTGKRFINGVEYFGPIYYEGTNTKYRLVKDDTLRIVSVEELNTKLRKKKKKQPLNIIPVGVSSRI